VHLSTQIFHRPALGCIVDMKAIALLTAACATAVIAELEQVKPRALYTIETAPGQSVQITEEERWELSSVS
jgi:leucyl aminopeptidase